MFSAEHQQISNIMFCFIMISFEKETIRSEVPILTKVYNKKKCVRKVQFVLPHFISTTQLRSSINSTEKNTYSLHMIKCEFTFLVKWLSHSHSYQDYPPATLNQSCSLKSSIFGLTNGSLLNDRLEPLIIYKITAVVLRSFLPAGLFPTVLCCPTFSFGHRYSETCTNGYCQSLTTRSSEGTLFFIAKPFSETVLSSSHCH